MKRVICIILCFLMIVLFPGCHYGDSGDILEPVEFFYPRKTAYFIYGTSNGVIASEVREASGHINDLNYLIPMYLRGPQDSTLHNPFPAGSMLEEIHVEEDTLHILLSEEFAKLENSQLTLACTSLAMTCMTITDYTRICIDAASDKQTVSMVLDADTILFSDYSAFEPAANTEQSR